MRTEFYFRKEDAQKRAELFASENNGVISSRYGRVDEHTHFDYLDDDMEELGWTGESPAIMVVDADNYNEIGRFAFWTD